MKYLRVKYYVDKDGVRKQLMYWEPKKRFFVQGEWRKCPFKARPIDNMGEYDALIKALELWRKGNEETRVVVQKNTVHWLAVEFYKDDMYLSLEPITRLEYKKKIETKVLPVLGDFPLDKVTRQRARALYHALRDKPRTAEYTMMVARRMFNFGKNIGATSENPFTEMGISRNKPRDHIWTPEQVKLFQDKALEMNRRSMWLAMEIAHTIGTDTKTTRMLSKYNHENNRIAFTRSKSKVKVIIPLGGLQELRLGLATAPADAMQFVTNEITNRAYTNTNFCHVFREVANKAGIPKELQFKDLRRTAVGKLHKAGCTVPEIASIVGWGIDHCNQVIRNYFTDTEETAGNAIAKLVIRKLEVATVQAEEKLEVKNV